MQIQRQLQQTLYTIAIAPTNRSTTTIFSLNQDDGSLLDPSIYLSVPVCPSSHMRMDAPRSATPYLKVFMSAVSWRPVSLRSLP